MPDTQASSPHADTARELSARVDAPPAFATTVPAPQATPPATPPATRQMGTAGRRAGPSPARRRRNSSAAYRLIGEGRLEEALRQVEALLRQTPRHPLPDWPAPTCSRC